MTKKPKSKQETWYSAMFALADCDQAAVIRTFFAPVYLVYLNQEEGKSLVAEQCDWIDRYGAWMKEHEWDEIETKSGEERIQARIRTLGHYFCGRIEAEHGLECGKFLGKNRNVEHFPERFLLAVFPEQDIGIFWDLAEHFKALLKCIYTGEEELLWAALGRIRQLNRENILYRVPEITFKNNDDFLEKCELLGYLLCAICLLSSAKRVEEVGKNGLSLSEKSVFQRVQGMLEIPPHEEAAVREKGISLGTKDFLALLSAALDTHDHRLLEQFFRICQKMGTDLWYSEGDSAAIYDFLEKVSHYKQVLPEELNDQSNNGFNAVIRELSLMIDLEIYWKEVLEKNGAA